MIIVGGGYWGNAIRDAAELRGVKAIVIDDGDEEGASRNAAGYVRWPWLTGQLGGIVPEWWDETHMAASRAHIERLGAVEVTEVVHDWRAGTVERPDLWMINPWEALPKPAMVSRVLGFRRDAGRWLVYTNLGDELRTDRLVIAAGVWTDPLLVASDIEPLGVDQIVGSAILAAGSLDSVVETHVPRPYHHVTARPWEGGRVRVGETVSRSYPDSKLGGLVNDVARLFPQLTGFWPITGRRPALPEATVKELGDGLVVAVGGHRIGLALAGGVAQRVMEVLK